MKGVGTVSAIKASIPPGPVIVWSSPVEGSFKDKLKGNANAAAGTNSPTAVGCWGHTTRVEASALQQEVAQWWNRRDHLPGLIWWSLLSSSTVVLSIYSKRPLLLLLSDCLFSLLLVGLCFYNHRFHYSFIPKCYFNFFAVFMKKRKKKKKEKPWINQFRTCDLPQFDSEILQFVKSGRKFIVATFRTLQPPSTVWVFS